MTLTATRPSTHDMDTFTHCPALQNEARNWLKDCFTGDDASEEIDHYTAVSLARSIHRHYEGGLEAFNVSLATPSSTELNRLATAHARVAAEALLADSQQQARTHAELYAGYSRMARNQAEVEREANQRLLYNL